MIHSEAFPNLFLQNSDIYLHLTVLWPIYDTYLTVFWLIFVTDCFLTYFWQIYDRFLKLLGPTLAKSTDILASGFVITSILYIRRLLYVQCRPLVWSAFCTMKMDLTRGLTLVMLVSYKRAALTVATRKPHLRWQQVRIPRSITKEQFSWKSQPTCRDDLMGRIAEYPRRQSFITTFVSYPSASIH